MPGPDLLLTLCACDTAHLLVRKTGDCGNRPEGNVRFARPEYRGRKRGAAGLVLSGCVSDGREVGLVLLAKPDTLPTVEEFLHGQHSRVSVCDKEVGSIASGVNGVKFCDSFVAREVLLAGTRRMPAKQVIAGRQCRRVQVERSLTASHLTVIFPLCMSNR